MSYELIDSIIDEWAKKNEIVIEKLYKDSEVRTTNILGPKNKSFQIWIDPPDNQEKIGVHVWDYKKRRKDFIISVSELTQTLDTTLEIINEWIN